MLAFPEKTETERHKILLGFYRNFADLIVETLKLQDLSPDELRKRAVFTNGDAVRAYLAAGQPVLIMASHQCNWEWAPSAAVLNGFPADAVYKPLNNPFFEEVIRQIRATFGAKPVPMQQLLRDMVARKNEPRLIALVADQMPDAPETAWWTPFLHQETPFYTGTEKLARRYKLPVFFIEMQRAQRSQYQLTFHCLAEPPYTGLPDGELLNRYRDILEYTIRKAPSDWLWSHKRWKHRREKYGDFTVRF